MQFQKLIRLLDPESGDTVATTVRTLAPPAQSDQQRFRKLHSPLRARGPTGSAAYHSVTEPQAQYSLSVCVRP